MKRIAIRLLSLITIIAMLSSTAFAAPAPKAVYDGKPDTYAPTAQIAGYEAATLFAAQNNPVGAVCIDRTGQQNEYLVTFKLDPDNEWFLNEIHFEGIAANEIGFLSGNGGLIPGKFTVKENFDVTDEVKTYSFIYRAGDEVVNFAAHAVVYKPAVYEYDLISIASDEETLCSADNGATWPSAVLAWVHPVWPSIDGANWIWESELVDTPRTGDTIMFKRSFTVDGVPTAATLLITADNNYTATINGGPDTPFTKIDTNSWEIDSYDVLGAVKEGENILEITGINWAWDTDSATENPGAIAYKLCVEHKNLISEAVCETAWGFGTDVDGGNWSMIIDNDVPAYAPIEDPSKVFGANITSWYSENTLLDTSVFFNFDNFDIADISYVKFTLFDGDEVLGTRTSTGANLVTLLKDCAQYWGATADTYLDVTGVRAMSAAFRTRASESDNGYWVSSASEIAYPDTPTKILVEVRIGDTMYQDETVY